MTKDSPEDSTFETLSTILTIENLNSDNLSYLTINCDTGQHSQFLRCFGQNENSSMISQKLSQLASHAWGNANFCGKRMNNICLEIVGIVAEY